MRREYDNIYMIGIGGIGMSAIARYYNFKGKNVSGYDRTESSLTRTLVSEGIKVHYDDRPDLIPQDVENTLVIYTPAVPASLQERQYVSSHGYRIIKRSEMLGEIAEGQNCLAVAGTHGKTTTSTMIAHILTEGGDGCSAFLGGISKNYNTNLLVSKTNTIVAEADEYDRSFLQLHPAIAAITAMDADHLDIYGDVETMREAFREFAAQVSETIVAKFGLKLGLLNTKVFTYHLDNKAADCHADNIRLDATGHYTYDLVYPGGVLQDIKVGALGKVNVENSIAAAAVCLCNGMDAQKVKHAIGTFCGVKRRLDVHVNTPEITYIDDYAHHPAELDSTITSIREIFPERKITAIFQPHLYTRTRDFADEFAAALSKVDKLVLLDIYPAREEPIPGVTSKIIYDKVTAPEKVMIRKDELMGLIRKENLDVLVTFGAGDIDRFIEPITDYLLKK